jgi:hypothetical protein
MKIDFFALQNISRKAGSSSSGSKFQNFLLPEDCHIQQILSFRHVLNRLNSVHNFQSCFIERQFNIISELN